VVCIRLVLANRTSVLRVAHSFIFLRITRRTPTFIHAVKQFEASEKEATEAVKKMDTAQQGLYCIVCLVV